ISARTFRNNIVNRTPSAQKCDADHIRPGRPPPTSRITRYFRLEEETRYDLDFGRHGRPALHNSRYAACDIVDIHSGVRRTARVISALLHYRTRDCCREIRETPKARFLFAPKHGHAVVTDV